MREAGSTKIPEKLDKVSKDYATAVGAVNSQFPIENLVRLLENGEALLPTDPRHTQTTLEENPQIQFVSIPLWIRNAQTVSTTSLPRLWGMLKRLVSGELTHQVAPDRSHLHVRPA